ncbi:MAG: hypothetical protein KBC53_02110, partial [Nitrosomonas sp.]|nr:hypothetical protein [Nitrosomonas sp.]
MVQQVRAYGQVLQFPDDMSDDDMAKAIQNNEHVLNPNFKAPEGLSGIAKNVVSGTKQTGRMVGAGFDTIRNELVGVEDYAKASDIARQQETPIEQRKLLGELSSIDRDQGALRQIGDTLSAAGRNPMGTAQMITEQLPNTAVSLGGGYAGFKTGAAAGSLLGPVGAAIGGTLGFVSGMFLGNVLLEAGGKAIEKASDEDGFTPQDRDTSLREGAVKAAVITGVDAATFKIGGVLASKMGGAAIQAGAKAETKVLMDAGVDVASLTAINSALKASPELYRTARVAGEKAVLQSLSTGKKAAIIGTGVALETAGEGVGEYAGEYAATGKGDVVDATIEALSSATMSVAETAYNYNKVAIGNDLSPEGIKKVADNINERDVNEGVSNINKASSVDEAIKAANDVVSRKPTTSDDVLSSIDPTLKDIERLTGLKPSEAVARVINEAQQAQDSTQTQSQAKSILSGSSVSIQVPQPTNEAINEEEITKQKTDTEKSSGVLGRESEIVLPDGTSLPAQWQVVDADSVSASIKEGVNQPRDRTRAASDIQIQGIANNPDYRRLSDSPVMDVGAPVLSHNGLIVGGNGRFEGISRSHEQGSSSDYRDSLINDAINKGIDPSVIAGMKKPVLVRRITQPFDTRKLAIASNSGTSLQYSGLELAKIDAGRMAGIEDLDITDSGDIALTGSNIERLKMSLGDFSPAELSSLVGKNGELSQDGVKRVRNAMLAKAYGNSETLGRIVESTDGDMRNVLGALTKSAGVVAKARSEISAGAVPKEVDITDNLLDAVETFSQIRAKNQPLENYLAQQNMFGDGIDSDSQEILQFLHDNVRSQKKLTEFIKQVYDQITRIDQTTDNIFGDNSVPSKSEIIKNAKQRTEGQSTEQQQGIFAAKSSEEAGGSDGQESKTQADNAGSGEESQQDSGLNTETSKTVFDSFSALGNETGSAVQAMYDAEQITGLKLGIPIEYAKLGELIPARFDIARKIIEVNTNWFFTKAEGAQFIAEEILHYVDSVSNEKTISASSKLLDWDNGEIINELREHFESKGAYSTFLKYPIDNQEFRSLSIDRKKAEVFARMGVLYFGELDKLSHVLPKTYRAYHGIFKVTRDPVVEEISRKVWSFNPSPYRKVGGEYKSMGASLSSDGSFSGEGNSAELGRLREVIGLSFRAKPSGEKANLSDKSSLETKEAKFSRTAEERLKDRERARQLEKKLNGEGYEFSIEAKDVRMGATQNGRGQEAATAERIAKIFGRRVVWIEASGDFRINGVVVPSIKDTIFIDYRTDKYAHAVIGHELSHHMEHDVPAVYRDMVRALLPMINDIDAYRAKNALGEDMSDANVVREIVGDIMGDNFTDPVFWNKVAESNPSAFKRIADAVISWLKRLATNAKMRGLGSEQWVTDAQKAQDIVAKAVAQYTNQSNAPASGKAKFHSAFHGSPHDHDKFDSSKIGTGEGAQAYGHGLYFAESKDVAEYYKKLLVNFKKPKYLVALESRLEKAIINDNQSQIDYFQKAIDNYPRPQGKLYEVELAPEQDEYLLWDKPLSGQSDKVKSALDGQLESLNTKTKRIGSMLYASTNGKIGAEIPGGMSGQGLYSVLKMELGSDKKASEHLHSLGIRGIKYLDGSSRDKGEGAYNYVIFDDNDVSITAKFSRAPKSLDAVEKSWDSKGIASSMSERNGIITLNKIVIPKDSRNAGMGTAAMRELTNYADTTNQQIALTPSADFGGNKVKLQAFYKRLGFRKNNEFNVMESMIRDPESAKFSRAPKLYSKLEQALEAANDKVFSTGSQVKLWLQSNAGKLGIKKDEIYWSGIDNWLDAQGKVSKQQVVEFIRNNGVQVEDVTLGDISKQINKDSPYYNLKKVVKLIEQSRDPVVELENNYDAYQELSNEFPDLVMEDNWSEDVVRSLIGEKKPDAKHNNDKLTLPGGTDYKELVVTIPTIEKYNESDDTHFGDTGQGKQIGWLRMDTRDGGLFIEELQSQRAQQGRSKGFQREVNQWFIAYKNGPTLGDSFNSEQEARAELVDTFGKRDDLEVRPGESDRASKMIGVPPAPFVSDANNKATNAYITLLMKKALIEAVSNDHASVSWTTGDQQADRYDLSKQVDTIAYAFSKDRDTVTIQATKDNSFMYGKNNLPVAELADNFGKDIANKITNDEGETNYQTGYKELSGLDLKTGGEWAQSMYGNEQGLNLQGKPSLMSQAANDIFKHVGSGKVESINGQPGFYVTPEMRSKDLPLFSRVISQDSKYLDAVNSGDMEKAQKLVNDKLAIIGAYWHGTPSGDLRGGMTGLHVGTKQAAMEALEARIGIPADGRGWDGTREYGKTLLAGRDRVASGQFGKYRDSGYNIDSPKDDFYAEDHELPTVGNDVKVDPSWKPWIRPVLIVGDMDKRKKTDSAANSLMYKLLSQGKATRGFYYENDGEDAGSVSAVLPNGDHVKIKLPDAVTYDDEGNVIPLSERFNKDNNDIRFSRAKPVTVDGIERPTTNSEGKQINNPVN